MLNAGPSYVNDPGIITHRNYGLDLTRSVAISMVLIMHGIGNIYHVALPWFWYLPLGGVDLFFSLSGFLIGRMLMADLDPADTSTVLRFWKRRWLRTVPAYLFYYLLFLLLSRLGNEPVRLDPAYFIFIQNLRNAPLHYPESWSLSIEEWSYLIMPMLIVGLSWLFSKVYGLKNKPSYFLISALMLIVMMIVVRWTADVPAGYLYGLLYRLDAIAYGLIAAYISTKRISFSGKSAAWIILIGIVTWALAVLVLFQEPYARKLSSLYYLFAGIGISTVVFGMFYFPFRKQFRMITLYSKYSYSIYLLNHSIILVALSRYTSDAGFISKTVILFLSLALIIFLGGLSYRFLEKPVLSFRDRHMP